MQWQRLVTAHVRQTTVTALLKSKQLLLFAFVTSLSMQWQRVITAHVRHTHNNNCLRKT